jgi:hypothetical protein
MRIRSPIVTLLVGLLIALITVVLSVRARHTAPPGEYGAPVRVVTAR